MTRQDLADVLNISRQTLNAWEKDKPDLVRLINQGLAFDEIIKNQKKSLSELEAIQADASNGKFKLK